MKAPSRPDANTPRWVTEKHYDGIEKDVAEFWTGAHFWQIAEGKGLSEADMTEEVVARVMAEATMAAEDNLGDFAVEVSERARQWMLWRARKEGLNRYAPAEYDTMREMIAAMIDPDKPRKYAANLMLWQDEILPALEQAGVPVESVLGVQDGAQRMVESAPKIKRALDSGDVNEAARLAKIVASSPNLGEMRVAIHNHAPVEEDDKLQLQWYLLGDGRKLGVVMCETDMQVKYLLYALRKIINEHLGERSATELISEIMTWMGYDATS